MKIAICLFLVLLVAGTARAQVDFPHLLVDGRLVFDQKAGKVSGICQVRSDRTALRCRIYNGFTKWEITDFWIAVSVLPVTDVKYCHQRIFIEPLTASVMVIELGMQLPKDRNGKSRWIWTPHKVSIREAK